MRKFSIFLVIALFVQAALGSNIGYAANQSKNQDIKGHWAQNVIQSWLDEGIIHGYEDGSFKPNGKITRAELIKILNNVFNVPETSSHTVFSDVSTNHWAYQDIQKAYAFGYVTGTGNQNMSPNVYVTRQEAAVMISKLANITGSTTLSFKDSDKISIWSKSSIESLVSKGYLKGDSSGNLRPTDFLTRAEAVTLSDTVSKNYEVVLDKSGEYGNDSYPQTYRGNIRVAAANITLVNTTILGSLIIDKAVGEGDVTLNKVNVKGDTLVQGGGKNSIHLEETVLFNLIVDKETGTVRIVAGINSEVHNTIIQSSVILLETESSSLGFSNVIIEAENSEVELSGHFDEVDIQATSIKVYIPEGGADIIVVSDGTSNIEINTAQGTNIAEIILRSVAKILGHGNIQKASISPEATNSTFSREPEQKVAIPSSSTTPSPTPVATIPVAQPPIVVPPVGPTPVAPTPTPVTPTPPVITPPKSSDASLNSITLSSDLILEKFSYEDVDQNIPVIGFDKSVQSYTVDLPKTLDKQTVTLTLNTAPNASIIVLVKNVITNELISVKNEKLNEYSFEVDNKEGYDLTILVSSEDGENETIYYILFVGNYEIENIFAIRNQLPQYSNFGLSSALLKGGDKVDITIPAIYSATNQEESVSFTVSNNGGYYGGYTQVYELFELLSNKVETGYIHIQVTRNNEIIISDDYNFDFTPLIVDVTDDLLQINTRYTTEQLDLYEEVFNDDLYIHAYYSTFVIDANYPLYEQASYITYNILDVNPFYGVPKYNYENIKQIYTINGSPLQNHNIEITSKRYLLKDLQGMVEARTQITVGFYDSNKQLLGVTKQYITFSEEHLASNVTPMYFPTYEELLARTQQLTSVVTSIDLPFYDAEGEEQFFESDVYDYFSAFTSEDIGSTLAFTLEAEEGFIIDQAYTTDDINNPYLPFETITLSENTDYYITVDVLNPYTLEKVSYTFTIVYADVIIPDFVSLTLDAMYFTNINDDYEIKLILPASVTDKSEDVTIYTSDFYYTNSNNIAYIGFHQFDIIEEGIVVDTIKVNMLGKAGSLTFDILVDGESILEEEEEINFDFSPLGEELELTNVEFSILSKEELATISPPTGNNFSAGITVDISDIESAKYSYFLSGIDPDQYFPNYQDANSIPTDLLLTPSPIYNHFYRAFINHHTGSEMLFKQNLYYLYLFDENHILIGYAVFDFSFEESHVADNVILLNR